MYERCYTKRGYYGYCYYISITATKRPKARLRWKHYSGHKGGVKSMYPEACQSCGSFHYFFSIWKDNFTLNRPSNCPFLFLSCLLMNRFPLQCLKKGGISVSSSHSSYFLSVNNSIIILRLSNPKPYSHLQKYKAILGEGVLVLNKPLSLGFSSTYFSWSLSSFFFSIHCG